MAGRYGFFDAGMTAWGRLEDKTRQSEDSAISWLTKEGYLLNRFGRQTKGANLKESLAANGEWQTKLRSSNRNVKSWNATIGFDALTTASGRENGNIANMYDKGDLEYLFSWKVYTVKTSWWLFGTSNDKGDTTIFGETKKSSGGGWKNYNTYGNGGPNLGDNSAWHSADKLSTLYFKASSDKDEKVDSYLSGAMLVGRDIKGPQISSVKVTSDEAGEKTIPGGAITLDTIDSTLTNRTVYFHVTWDEPVVFQNMSRQAIAGLSLLINTEGIDKSTAQTAEAAFLRFAPSKNDAKPVMVFEYQIPDPYTDPGAQERGYYYRFKNVTVSSSENAAFWNNIYDLSGNKFAADKDGVQPSKQMRVAIDGAPYVDLRPFGIESIRVTPDRTTRIADENSAFLEAGRVFVVTLTLNKTLRNGVSNMDLPSLTLNVKDAEGNFVTISPSEEYLKRVEKNKSGAWEPTDKYVWIGNRCVKPVMLWDNQRISYYIQLYPGYTMDGDSIRVTAVTADKSKVKDDAGYSMMNYALEENFLSPTDMPEGAQSRISQYQVAPDRQYKLDFDPPEITVNAKNPDDNGVVMISAAVTDPSLAGTDASFTVKVNGNFSDDVPVQYQAASSESYNDASWISADTGVSSAAFSTPVMQGADSTEGTAYGFIKLPQPGEADTLDVSVTVTDEAGNSATKTETITTSYDILAPRIDAKVIGEEVSFEISDIDDSITYYYGYSENDTTEPIYTIDTGKSGTLPPPPLPEGNEVYSRVAWIKASDSSGNVSGIIKLPVKFDRTYTTIDYTADTSKTYLAEDYPTVEATIENVTGYWYMWAEKPAGVADTAAYISDRFIADMKSYAESLNQVEAVADEDPDTEQSNNATNIAPALSGTSAVAKINPEDESYDGTIYAEDTSRPIMLIIAAEKDDGTTLVKTVEFDTFYSAPAVNVTQTRFSTNNHKGKRVDYTVGDQTLLMANDTTYSYPLNTPSLYSFAQAELRIALDPVTGLDRVDLGGSTVTLERVVYEGEDLAASEFSRETLNTWTFTELGFNENVNTVIADIDPAIIDASYYEQYSVGEDSGYRRPVRYELVCNMQYAGDIPSVRTPITYYAFNNTPEAYLYEICCEVGEYTALANGLGAYENQNVEAIFDSDGKDITANVPLYTAQTKDYEGTEGYEMYLKFTTNGNSGDACMGDKAYYGAPVQNTVDPENTAKLLLHIGTDPDNLTEIPFSSTQYYIESGTYDISEYLLGKGDAVSEVKLYYRFEHPERGEMSPLYVMNVRTDNEPPVFDITVSETERMTNEVSVKLHSVYDVQTLPDGTVYYDTEQPTDEWFSEGGTPELYAWRKATENDDAESLLEIGDAMPIWTYDEAADTETITDYYIRVRPDEEGFYRFTRNGFFAVNAVDNAENYTTSVLINGEPAELEFLGDKLGSIFEFN